MIEGLPPRLQTQVVLQLNVDFIRSIPMFEGKSLQFIFAIVKRLQLDFALPGDAVAWQVTNRFKPSNLRSISSSEVWSTTVLVRAY